MRPARHRRLSQEDGPASCPELVHPVVPPEAQTGAESSSLLGASVEEISPARAVVQAWEMPGVCPNLLPRR